MSIIEFKNTFPRRGDISYFLDLVEAIKPTTAANWDEVASVYNSGVSEPNQRCSTALCLGFSILVRPLREVKLLLPKEHKRTYRLLSGILDNLCRDINSLSLQGPDQLLEVDDLADVLDHGLWV